MNTQQLWQSQEADAPRVTLDYVRHGATAFERRIFWRNALEYVGAAASVAICSFLAWEIRPQRPLLAASVAWFALFGIYAAVQWHRKAGRQVAPADAGVLDTLRFQRRHLEMQRDARRGNWRWWVPPYIPGAALMITSQLTEMPDPLNWRTLFMIVVLFSSVIGGIQFYERGARRLQREIDALDSLARG
jgi:membrane associated rhomboid family serine protease